MKKNCLIILLLLSSFWSFGQHNALLLENADHIEVPDNDSLDLNNLTIEAWVNISSMATTGSNMICSKGWCGDGDFSYYFTIRQGRLQWIWYTSGDCTNGSRSSVTSDSVLITEDSCYHVAVTHTPTGVTLYVDGQAVSTTLTGVNGGGSFSNIQNSKHPLHIGTYYTSGGNFVSSLNGSITDFRIWNTSRSIAQIQQNRTTQLLGNESGLVLYFPLQAGPSADGSVVNNQATSTSTTNNGTISGTATSPSFVTACPYYISVDDNASIDLTNNLTIETWVNIPIIDTTGTHTICSKGYCGTGDYAYYLVVRNGFLEWTWYQSGDCTTGTRHRVTSTVPLPANTCVHVAVVHTATGVTFYLDGQAVTTTLSGNYSVIKSSSAPLLLGIYRSVASGYVLPLNGGLNEFRMWNTARSQAQIQANRNTPLNGTQSDLVVYFPLVAGNGTTTTTNNATATGTTNNGTINGSLVAPFFLLECVPSINTLSTVFQPTVQTTATINPNPFTTTTTLTLNNYSTNNGPLTLVVYDHLGRIVYHKNNLQTSSIPLEGQFLETGIYFYQLRTSKEVLSTGKIQKIQ